jgi:hypothetical protein
MNQFKQLSSKDKKWLWGTVIVIAICFTCFSIFPNWTRDRNLDKMHRYTIATVVSFVYGPDGGADANFVFTVNGIEYKGSGSACCRLVSGECEEGDFILIEYYPPDPKYNNRVGDYYFAPNGSIIIPSNGWETLPPSLSNVLQGR